MNSLHLILTQVLYMYTSQVIVTVEIKNQSVLVCIDCIQYSTFNCATLKCYSYKHYIPAVDTDVQVPILIIYILYNMYYQRLYGIVPFATKLPDVQLTTCLRCLILFFIKGGMLRYSIHLCKFTLDVFSMIPFSKHFV